MITRALYKSIEDVLLVAKAQVKLSANWRTLHDEYGIGLISPCKGVLKLSSTDRMALVNWVIRQTGVDPRQVSYEQMISRSRTQAAGVTNEEKALSADPRADHVEVRSLNGIVGKCCHPADGYLGLRVAETLTIPFTYLITVENFDTFISLHAEYLPMFPKDNTLLVFRGDNKAHPGAVKKLLEQTSAHRVHYGDYDSAGLRIGLNMGSGTTLVLPDLEHITGKELAKLSKLSAFAKQEEILRQLECHPESLPAKIAIHLQIIRDHNIAVTQESLMANRVPLTLLPT
ncbi:DUF7281 domain-containing protein [Endozoicomonas ascidiicola]|uniref:DUF7281 domain-containing protein n=1 Tax=Endozoicomonas ascidiicola TaxID=1698521 RepID=UPI0008304D26|nr:hypothetical protein [Endozoicomonas ascidiicola]USN26965.1 hypothetical protein [synthetic construct]